MHRVEIAPLNLRDASFITANLREEDRAEAACQLRKWDPLALAVGHVNTEFAWQAKLDGKPVIMFGAGAIMPLGLQAWSLATPWYHKVMPRVLFFCRGPLIRAYELAGYRWVEARVMESNESGRRFLQRLGARPVARLAHAGVNGETFLLYRRVLADVESAKQCTG